MSSKPSSVLGSILVLLLSSIFVANLAADTIDFQTGSPTETGAVGSYTILGSVNVWFENAIYAKAGAPRYAFLVDTLPGPDLYDQTSGTGTSFDSSGNWFITDRLGTGDNAPSQDPGTNIIVNFGSAVSNVSFDLADLDLVNGVAEILTVKAFSETSKGGSLLTTYTANASQFGFGDGSVKNISILAAGIRSIEIDVSGPSIFGFGVDNLSVVPTPGALVGLASMSIVGLAGVGLRRWRRRLND